MRDKVKRALQRVGRAETREGAQDLFPQIGGVFVAPDGQRGVRRGGADFGHHIGPEHVLRIGALQEVIERDLVGRRMHRRNEGRRVADREEEMQRIIGEE